MPFVNFVGYGVKLQKENKNRKMIISRKFFSSFAAPPPQLYIEILVRKFQRYIYLPKYILDDQLKKNFQFLFTNYTFQPPNHKKIFDLSVECKNPNSY